MSGHAPRTQDCGCGCGCGSGDGYCPSCGCPKQDALGLFSQFWQLLLSLVDGSWKNGERLFKYTGPDAEANTVVVQLSSCKAYWFTQAGTSSAPTYAPQDKANVRLEFNADDCRFIFTDCDESTLFFDKNGALSGKREAGGRTTEATDYTPGGLVKEVQTAIGDLVGTIESFAYDYLSGASTFGAGLRAFDASEETESLLWRVTLRRRSGDGPWFNIRRVVYTYYGADEPGGPEGMLKTATTQLPCGLEWVDLDTQYFRYYADGEAGGFAGALKFVLEPTAFARMRETLDPLAATDAELTGFATRYFEYDEATQRITKLVTDAGLLTSLFEYEFNSASSSSDDDFNVWTVKTTTTRPDGSRTIEFYNSVDNPMLRDTVEGTDPDERHWLEYHRFNEYGLEDLSASPSAVESYDQGEPDLGVVLRSDAGLIRTTSYYTSTTATPTTLGGVEAYVESTALQEGTGGTPVPQSLTRYLACPNDALVFEVGEETVYRNDDGTGEIVTTYEYEWFDDTAQISQKVTTWPIVPEEQNGSGVASQTTELYDLNGNQIWERGPRGFIRNMTYDAVTGALLQQIDDVDGTLVPLPDGWTTPAGGGLNLVTDYEADDQGRTTQTLGPAHDASGQGVRTAAWTVYDDLGRRTLSAQGYASGLAGSYVYTLVNPVTISRTPRDGRSSETIRAVRACRCDSYAGGISSETCCNPTSGNCEATTCPRCCTGRLSAADCFPQATWVAWSQSFYNVHGQRTSSRVYHRIPACGAGTSGSACAGGDYDETTYGYDVMNRQNRVVTPGGTIMRTVFDVRSLTLDVYVGTNDAGATDDDPTGAASGSAASGNNMLLTLANEYDDGLDGGDGNLTSVLVPVDDDGAHDRITTYGYDFRNRRLSTSAPELAFVAQTYDNLSHVIESTSSVGESTSSGGGAPIASTYTYFDDRGQVYQTERSGYDATTHVETARLTSLTWYDPDGNPLKQVAAGAKNLRAFTKTSYDGVARRTASYVGLYTGDLPEPYDTVGSVADDLVFEQSVPTYDQAGNVLETIGLSRYPSDVTTTGPLDDLLGRQSRSATWYDGIGRSIASADYGTSELERSDEIPPSTDAVPVARTRYDAAGQAFESLDPSGRVARSAYDAAGRLTAMIANFTGGCAGNAADVTVRRTYDADGHLETLTAVNPDTGDQTTTYYYGVSSAAGSLLASNDLLAAVVYPDAKDGADRVSYAYNRQGEAIAMTDQNGTAHAYDYDGLGRRTADRVTTVGVGIDDAVRRLETVYDDRQQVESQTSYDAPTGGTALNQVAYEYDAFGLPHQETQTAGAASGTVQYFYGDPSANTLRRSLTVYPAGRAIRYQYGLGGSVTDLLSQIVGLFDDNVVTNLVEYTYLGVGSIFRCDYLQPQVRWDLSPVGDSFTGLDSLGRVVDNLWRNYGDSTDADRVQYTYDRNGNRTSRANDVAASGNDELYRYDGLNRLTNLARGTLSDGVAPLTSPQAGEAWRLDATGNWNGYQGANYTTPANTVEQNRTANAANEITAITPEVGPAWTQPLYDRAGNMISLPQPKAPTEGYTATYDAWNRLVTLEDDSSVVAAYGYDPLTRRITVDDGTAVRRTYFSNRWQALEERLGDSTDPERQFIWGLRYIDDLVLRDRSVGGTLDERLYALQDANWNATAIVDDGGDVAERYRYSAYGTPTFLDADFNTKSPNQSEFDWETLYCGYRFDADSGLYYVRWRYLNAKLGEWLTKDPIGYTSDINLYRYVSGAPLSRSDSQGLAADDNKPFFSRIRKIFRSEQCCAKGKTNTIYFPDFQCCTETGVVAKKLIRVINRDHIYRPVDPKDVLATAGHLDLWIPEVGMVGFYGVDNGNPRLNAMGIKDGLFNVTEADWMTGPARRPEYVTGVERVEEGIGTLYNDKSIVCDLWVCPSQLDGMRQRLSALRAKPPGYSGVGSNCSTVACDILRAGNINPKVLPAFETPIGVIDEMIRMGADCYFAYTKVNFKESTLTTPGRQSFPRARKSPLLDLLLGR